MRPFALRPCRLIAGLLAITACMVAFAGESPGAAPEGADSNTAGSNTPDSTTQTPPPTAPVATISAAEANAPPPPLPDDAQLEAAGARIGTITVRSMQIFDTSDPRENNWAFRTANHLHVRTREGAIRAQLLFHSGDRYSRHVLDESARVLRELDFVREPTVRPTAYHDGVVDVEVITHDVWTLQPGLSFSRSGGANRSSVEFEDSNLLGTGKSIDVGHSSDVDRSSSFIRWNDPNVFGTRWTDELMYSDNSDGKVWTIVGERPFFSLDTHYAGGLKATDSTSIEPRYLLGNPYDAYTLHWRAEDAYFGGSYGRSDQWIKRWIAGFRRDDSQFSATPTEPLLGPLPQDRRLSYPYGRLQWIEDTYSTTHNLDLIARTEDIHFGVDAALGLGWLSPILGSDRHGWIADARTSYGWHISDRQVLLAVISLGGRLESSGLRDGLVSLNASYYWATSDRTKLLVRLSEDAAHRPDLDHYLELGGDFGLRGYPLRYQLGTSRSIFTVEERLYTNWYLWRLVNVGAAAFFDAGRTSGTSPIDSPQLGLLKDVGVGLRLGNARSSFGNVIHIDLAAPLGADRSISKLQFVVQTERTF
jgi:hypothetical protein